MLPFKLKKPYSRRPPGGWQIQKDGTIITGETPEELEEKVREHMIQNGKAPGNIFDEITMHCHANWPHLTEPNLEYGIEPNNGLSRSDVQRKVFDWLGKMSLSPQESPPAKSEIDDRIKTCAACKFNKHYNPDDVLFEPIRRKVFLMTKGNIPNGLGFCAKWNIDTRLACQWSKSLLGPVDSKEDFCWRSDKV